MTSAVVGHILFAEDDPDDQMLARSALSAAAGNVIVEFVDDGQALLERLRDRRIGPRPDLLIVDLNMPRKGGREAILELKRDPRLRHLPVIVFTTSVFSHEVRAIYEMGACSFVTKPDSYAGWLDTMQKLVAYWFELVKLPTAP